MLIEYFDYLEKQIIITQEIRSKLKVGDNYFEEHLNKLTLKIHYLQVEQDNLFLNK